MAVWNYLAELRTNILIIHYIKHWYEDICINNKIIYIIEYNREEFVIEQNPVYEGFIDENGRKHLHNEYSLHLEYKWSEELPEILEICEELLKKARKVVELPARIYDWQRFCELIRVKFYDEFDMFMPVPEEQAGEMNKETMTKKKEEKEARISELEREMEIRSYLVLDDFEELNVKYPFILKIRKRGSEVRMEEYCCCVKFPSLKQLVEESVYFFEKERDDSIFAIVFDYYDAISRYTWETYKWSYRMRWKDEKPVLEVYDFTNALSEFVKELKELDFDTVILP